MSDKVEHIDLTPEALKKDPDKLKRLIKAQEDALRNFATAARSLLRDHGRYLAKLARKDEEPEVAKAITELISNCEACDKANEELLNALIAEDD